MWVIIFLYEMIIAYTMQLLQYTTIMTFVSYHTHANIL